MALSRRRIQWIRWIDHSKVSDKAKQIIVDSCTKSYGIRRRTRSRHVCYRLLTVKMRLLTFWPDVNFGRLRSLFRRISLDSRIRVANLMESHVRERRRENDYYWSAVFESHGIPRDETRAPEIPSLMEWLFGLTDENALRVLDRLVPNRVLQEISMSAGRGNVEESDELSRNSWELGITSLMEQFFGLTEENALRSLDRFLPNRTLHEISLSAERGNVEESDESSRRSPMVSEVASLALQSESGSEASSDAAVQGSSVRSNPPIVGIVVSGQSSGVSDLSSLTSRPAEEITMPSARHAESDISSLATNDTDRQGSLGGAESNAESEVTSRQGSFGGGTNPNMPP